MRPAHPSRRRIATVVVAAVATVLALNGAATALPSTAPEPTAAAAKAKIRPQLQTQLGAQESPVDFWVYFDAKADLSAARSIRDWNARGTAVARALRQAADESQRAVRGELTASGVAHQSFWATNAIKVTGDQALAERLAAKPEVSSLLPSFKVAPPPVIKGAGRQAVDAVEWGVADINADDVWEQFGVRGEDITVASIDTGVQFDHPALARQYRGNKGDGVFDHNYNWFDAAGACGGAPCDGDGHGTHTMGTMVGDDGAENRVGVAPKARWIAANGCCPSDAALISSGQWLLEPTDLNGQNPDAGKRPHVINNSWGTTTPSDAPFLEDISLAWTASGIFGVWANGNNGPGCRTSGAPGSRKINYSVGAYGSDHTIAPFSSRGAGQDGEIKPNVAAPGVNVRSSMPGSAYASLNGTSMAAPHVAGAVALVWSAAVSMVGDTEATRSLLDGTAVDNPDGQCGGTDDDNNAFGEGRLDALALMKQAPRGPTGRIGGTVSDAGTSKPLPGATVTITGPVSREVTTDAAGAYQSGALPLGSYTIGVRKYGYAAGTTQAQVREGEAVTADVRLTPQPMSTVSGTVTDGSGHGWPLYAKVVIDGYPLGPVFTDPVTGRYSVRLPGSASYTMRVTAQYPGYRGAQRTFELGGADLTQDAALTVDESSCTAPGYRFSGVGEDFDDWTDTGTRDGWRTSGRPGWRFDNPGYRPVPEGGGGRFAVADSTVGAGKRFDTTLTSPAIDLSGDASPKLTFRTSYYPDGAGQRAAVGVSTDGGRSWKTVWRQTTDHAFGQVTLPLPQAANRADVRIRFHYQGRDAWWWAVDDVFVGDRACRPVEGGLVVGFVTDRDTGAPVFATVSRTEQPGDTGTGVTTPADPALGDGLYWVFSSATGGTEFTARASGYQTATATVPVRADAVVTRDWSLARAGG
ncbi:S8 family serine peptidase [Micromonospora sp. CPCC 205554]|uniref:S8 family serine peptidase n=1 Tax=Micromonospora sp. CPCC 205554 TaxID=3122401 RepID=UPI002FF2E578